MRALLVACLLLGALLGSAGLATADTADAKPSCDIRLVWVQITWDGGVPEATVAGGAGGPSAQCW